jgi:hypothetical protein
VWYSIKTDEVRCCKCFDAEAEPLEAAGGMRVSDTAEMTKQIRWVKDQTSARDDIAERLERIDEELESLTDFQSKLAGAQDKLVDFLKDMSASMVKLAASVEKIAEAYDRFGAGISKLAEIEQRRIEAAAAPALPPIPAFPNSALADFGKDEWPASLRRSRRVNRR